MTDFKIYPFPKSSKEMEAMIKQADSNYLIFDFDEIDDGVFESSSISAGDYGEGKIGEFILEFQTSDATSISRVISIFRADDEECNPIYLIPGSISKAKGIVLLKKDA